RRIQPLDALQVETGQRDRAERAPGQRGLQADQRRLAHADLAARDHVVEFRHAGRITAKSVTLNPSLTGLNEDLTLTGEPYRRARRRRSSMVRAEARTWPSSCVRCSAGARTRGDGRVSTATMRLPCITWAAVANTPLWISSSLVAKPCWPASRIFFSSRTAASGSRSASGARYSRRT